jgi:release factor glutamine methyltransferase
MSDTVTVRALILTARGLFAAKDIDSGALDARLLLQAAAGLSHELIVAEPDMLVSADAVARFSNFVDRRCQLEPVSRILGWREFFGRRFQVTPAVLDPRADTETLIEAALTFARAKKNYRFLDLGTGSGAIAVTLLAELPAARGVASDLSGAALTVAQANGDALGVSTRLQLVQANWFSGIEGRFDLIASNPPYIPLGDIADLAEDVRDYDPLRALDGGPDGLEAYRRIADGAREFLTASGRVLVEIGAGQAPDVQQIFAIRGLAMAGQYIDLGGHVRCLTFAEP